jgi:hypothetical protein
MMLYDDGSEQLKTATLTGLQEDPFAREYIAPKAGRY